jgi:hypothetical protein
MSSALRRRLRFGAVIGALAWLAPAAAHADPVTATIAAFVNVIAGATAAAAVGNFLLVYGTLIYTTTASWALSKLSAPKGASSSQERQAQVAALTVGEVPREMIVGMAGTGGSLVDAYYYGGQYGTDWNTFVIALADHRCEALVGFYVGDTYVPFTGDGPVAGYNGQLTVYWRSGAADDAPFPGDIAGLGPATAAGSLKGVARVAVSYKADAPDAKNPIWTSGRPTFLWVVKGARCYDPRKDDTVPGGAGPHRWDDPETWEWSENAEICRYAFARGVYALDAVDNQAALRLGRGLSVYEAPPERVFAAANLCDEPVDIGSGTLEPRYRVGGVIKSNETFDRVEQMFADATGGYIIQPEGGVAVDPGQARTPVASITDDDLLTGMEAGFSYFRSASERVNTVVPRYVEPSQKWADTAATVCRDLDDIAADGGPAEETLALPLVTSRAQAERLGEMRRRQHRLERTATIQLGPRFAHLEEGDWIEWTSARFTKGETVVFRITAYALDAAWRNTLALEETSYDVFGFGGLPSTPTPGEPSIPPGALALGGVTVTPVLLQGDNDSLLPAVQAGWDVPVDPAILTVRAEVRLQGQTAVAPTGTAEVNSGLLVITNGVPPSARIEVRLVPMGAPGRAIVPSNWHAVTTGGLVANEALNIGEFTKEQLRTWTQLTDLANANARDALIRIAAAVAQASAWDQDLLGQILPESGRPIGATIDDQVRIVEDNTQAIVEHHEEMLVGFANSAAALSAEMLVRASADEALSLYAVNLAAVVSSNYATVTSQLATLTTNTSATASALTTLTTNFNNNVASVSSQLTALSNADIAQASSITTLSSTVGGHTSSISFLSTTLSTLSGQVGAAFGLRIAAGNKAIGFKGINNGIEGGFLFDADYFGISTGLGTAYPFFVSGSTVYMTNVAISGSLVVAGTVDAPQLASRAATSTSRSNASWTMTGGSFSTILSHYVYLAKAGTVDSDAVIAQHFPSGDRNWEFQLWIDGEQQFRCYGANGQDSVALSGSKDCDAGYRLVEVYWNAHSSVNIDYRMLKSMGSW